MSETNLGAEVKRLRGDRTLRQLSDQTGINYGTLSRIENNLIELPGRETLAALSEALRVPLSHLAQLAYCGDPHADHPVIEEPALA